MTQMTTSQLAAAARKYDVTYNEGCDGYNPYRDELKQRSDAAEAARPKTLSEQRDAILRELDRKDSTIARESGTYDQAEIDALRAEVARIEAAIAADFAEQWPRELTVSRRADWNALVRSMVGGNGKINAAGMTKINARVAEQGWGPAELKRAIALHKLS